MIGRVWKSRTFRLGLAAAALLIVLSNTAISDALVLADGQVLRGRVSPAPGGYEVLMGGAARVVERADVAVAPDGGLRVETGLASILAGSSKPALALALLAFLATPFLQALRLHLLLRAARLGLGLRENIRLAFAGNFMNFAAPFGSTAGDVYKAVAVARSSGRPAEGATLVLFDRAVGLGTLLFSVAIFSLLSADERLLAARPYILTLTILLMLGIAVYLHPLLRTRSGALRLTDRLPQAQTIRDIDALLQRSIRAPGPLVAAIATTLAIQMLAAGAFALVCTAIRLDIGAVGGVSLFSYFSTGEIIRALPGPPQGLGTVELAYRFFLAPCGSVSQILSAAVGIRMVNLLCALPGALCVAGVRLTVPASAPRAALAAAC